LTEINARCTVNKTLKNPGSNFAENRQVEKALIYTDGRRDRWTEGQRNRQKERRKDGRTDGHDEACD
jgi:hypothetical protein